MRRRQGKQRRLAKKRSLKKRYCEECNFIAVHPCQLDLDHIDGNHKNNQPENLKTLCANCHRLKTERAGEWLALPLRPTRA